MFWFDGDHEDVCVVRTISAEDCLQGQLKMEQGQFKKKSGPVNF